MPRWLDGVPAMGLMLGALAVFSVWLPAPLLRVMQRAAGHYRRAAAMSAVLVLLLAVPLLAALLCLATRSRVLVGTVEPAGLRDHCGAGRGPRP